MAKFIFSFFSLSLVALVLSACGIAMVKGSGNVVTEERSAKDFDKINLSGSGEIILTQSDTESVKVEMEDNLLPYLKTEVVDHTLKIYWDYTRMKTVLPTKPVKIYVSAKDISAMSISGSGSLEAETLKTENLDFTISGSGAIHIPDLAVTKLNGRISGSGNCTLSGTTDSMDMVISGSGKIKAAELLTRTTSITISGSGNANLNASDKLDIRISGSGEIKYSGNPQITQTISGSGKITHAN